MTTQEAYKAFADELMSVGFPQRHMQFVTADDIMAAGIIPDAEHDEINRQIMVAAQKILKITPIQFQKALVQRRKDLDQQIKREQQAEVQAEVIARRAAAAEALGGGKPPDNATDFVAAYFTHGGPGEITTNFQGECRVAGELIDPAKPINERILLLAEQCGLTIGKGKVMSTGSLNIATHHYMADRRNERLQAVRSSLQCTDPVAERRALVMLRKLCDGLFLEPAFADAAIRKFIWQVQRRMAGAYIEHLHALVFGGGQGTGKSELARAMLGPIEELSKEANMKQVVDDKNFALKAMFAVFVDELAKADKADVNEIKNVVTAKKHSARQHYTHDSPNIQINISLIGTADKRLRQIINDVAGMRRFIEVLTTPKHLAQRFDWVEEVERFPWLDLWRAVDPTTADPLMSVQIYADMLLAKQNDMRGRDNVESWLENLDIAALLRMANPKSLVKGQHLELFAEPLYLNAFRIYEMSYHPGSTATSMTTWGHTFKAMIESNKLPGWSHHKLGNKVFYRLVLDDVVEMPQRAATSVAVVK
jgi:virulence-associated protein E